MKFLFAAALFAAAAVSAQTTECAADYIVEACLGGETAKLADCATTDWECQCAAYQAIRTCFNNCPNDPRRHSYENQVIIFCTNASLYPSKTTSVVGAATTQAAASTTSTSPTESETSSRSGTASGAAAPSNTGAAGQLVVNTGGALLAVAGVVAAVL